MQFNANPFILIITMHSYLSENVDAIYKTYILLLTNNILRNNKSSKDIH